MARIPYPNPSEAPESVREALAAVPPLNVFRMLAWAETAFRPWLRFGGALLGRAELDARLRELAILYVGKLLGARYEWIQHEPIALAVGVSADQIAALDTGDIEAECFAEGERAVLQFTQEALRDVRVSNPTFAEVRELLGPREIVELLLTIGQYSMLARIMETLELDLDEPASVVESIRDPS